MNSIGFPPKIYSITEKGRKFITQWESCKAFDSKAKKSKKKVQKEKL